MPVNEPLGTIQRSTTADKVFEKLHHWIVSGQFKPGDVLPSQEELAKQLQVSRNTLREAIFRLSALGLVQSRQGIGTVVQPTSPSNYISSLPGHLLLDQITVTEFIEARLFTECNIVKMIVHRAEDQEIEALAAILARQKQALDAKDVAAFNKADIAFHMALGKASGNSVMFKFLETICELIDKYIKNSAQAPGNIERAYHSHFAIYEAIKARDSDLAEARITEHIRTIAKYTISALDRDEQHLAQRSFIGSSNATSKDG